MNGILYFSSTGNSLYIAQKIQQSLGGNIFYIPHYKGDGTEFNRIIIVSPIYSFGLPVHVFNMLSKLNTSVPIDIVLNYGGMIGGADYLTYKHGTEFGLNINSVHTVKMPENYTLSFTVPRFYMNSTLKSAPKRIGKIIASLQRGEQKIPQKCKTKEELHFRNKSNWYKIGQGFHVTDACIKCEKCISVCPANNITLSKDGICFGDKCIACLGCYHRCPKKAIQYKHKKKTFRYINPNINENDIGKDL